MGEQAEARLDNFVKRRGRRPALQHALDHCCDCALGSDEEGDLADIDDPDEWEPCDWHDGYAEGIQTALRWRDVDAVLRRKAERVAANFEAGLRMIEERYR